MVKKRGYNAFVGSFLTNYSAKNKVFVRYLLKSEDAKDSYKSLVSGNVSQNRISRVFRDSIKDIQQDKKSRPDQFVNMISENLAKEGNHEEVIGDFFNKGLIGKKVDSTPSKRNYTKLAIIGLLVVGLFFIAKSANNFDVMDAVIGGNEVIDLNVIYGTVFLVLGLAVVHFYARKRKIVKEKMDVSRGAMLFSYLFAGFFLVKSLLQGGFTGAVIGGGTIDLDVAYGVVFLLLGLAITHFKLNRD